jgi:hypothetical protein
VLKAAPPQPLTSVQECVNKYRQYLVRQHGLSGASLPNYLSFVEQFLSGRLGAWCLGVQSEYEPAPVDEKVVLRILPNLEIAAAGPGLEQSDRLALNAWAIPVSDFVWRLEAGKLLAAIEAGRPVEEFREFLTARSGAAIPDTVARLLDDVAERCTKVHDRGLARLIECADSALAALIANDTRTRKHCLRAGERHLVVPASSEAAFRRALREAGYLLSAGVTRSRAAGL